VSEATDAWSIYDRLLDGIPSDLTVRSYLIGSTWTLVDGGGEGMAVTFRSGPADDRSPAAYSGRPLRDMARNIKDWDLPNASLGMAAINAYYNRPDVIRNWVNRPLEGLRSPSAFVDLLPGLAGKKVAIVGHFPRLKPVADICELTILERNPQPGDLPDFACEYVLPEQDYVLITGTAIMNKTLPRLLQLSRNAFVGLVGPSLAFAPWWFDLGVDLLAGSVITDRESVRKAVAEGADRRIFDLGATMVSVRRQDVA
jgi:uncharacterized protein